MDRENIVPVPPQTMGQMPVDVVLSPHILWKKVSIAQVQYFWVQTVQASLLAHSDDQLTYTWGQTQEKGEVRSHCYHL